MNQQQFVILIPFLCRSNFDKLVWRFQFIIKFRETIFLCLLVKEIEAHHKGFEIAILGKFARLLGQSIVLTKNGCKTENNNSNNKTMHN